MAHNFTSRKDGVLVSKGDEYAVLDFLYQPICSTNKREAIYYETLSRVTSQSGENYNSQDFFENIGDEFIKQVCLHQIKHANSLNINKVVSLNVTMSCFEDDCFIENLLLFKTNKYAIEINELNCNTSAKHTLRNINKLQRNGFMIWLDDYHSNNEQANISLGNISWDYIKIDKSFLIYNSEDVMPSKSLAYVLSPFVNKGLIFEGVETSEQHEIVRATNSMAQGYYYSTPKKWIDFNKVVNHEHTNTKHSFI